MKNTRRFISAVMALAMVSALAPMGAFAADGDPTTVDQNSTTKSGTMTATYDVTAKYTVTIPPSAVIADTEAAATAQPIKAENVLLASGEKVVVTLSEASNTTTAKSTIFNAKKGDSTVKYTIKAGSDTVALGGKVAEFENNAEEQSVDMKFIKDSTSAPTVAGTHTETLTFGISVEDAAYVPKTFTSLSDGDILRVGDTLEVASGGYDFFDDGCSLMAWNAPFTVLRANVEGLGTPWTTVTEDVNGAYYVIKGNENNYFHFAGRLAVTDTSDGVIITTKNDSDLGSYWAINVHEP